MKDLWKDVGSHPKSAGAFFMCWLAVFAYTFLVWKRGIPMQAMALHLAMPVLSGALVAWWRFPRREGLLVRGWRPAGPPLSGMLVAVVAVSVVFLREGAVAATSGTWRAAQLGDFLLSWLVASSLFAAIASVLALLGAAVSHGLMKVLRR
jgi:hypothetical protein